MGDYNDNNYTYRQPSYGFQSRRACGPCAPQFEEIGYVAYSPLYGSRGLEDQRDGAVSFWQSLADPALGECVNAFAQSGRMAIPNYPQFGCGGSGQPGGGYADGGHAGGSHPDAGHANAGYYYDSPPDEAGTQAAFYGSPYVQPFAQSTCAPNNYYNAPPVPYSYGPSAPCAQVPAAYNGPETPEQLEERLLLAEQREAVVAKYAARYEERAKRKAEAEGHTNSHGSIGGHGKNAHKTDTDVLAEAMVTSEGFKGFLRSQLAKKGELIAEGDVDVDELKHLTVLYFTENPEELHGRHISATECESAAYQYIEHNKDNHLNFTWGSVLSLWYSGDSDQINKGDMASIH